MRAEKPNHILFGHRRGEQIALHGIASGPAKLLELFVRLHPSATVFMPSLAASSTIVCTIAIEAGLCSRSRTKERSILSVWNGIGSDS